MSRESVKSLARQVVLHKLALPAFYAACVAALVSTERAERLLIETRETMIANGERVPAGPALDKMPAKKRARRAAEKAVSA